jgi:hypothetical protein
LAGTTIQLRFRILKTGIFSGPFEKGFRFGTISKVEVHHPSESKSGLEISFHMQI